MKMNTEDLFDFNVHMSEIYLHEIANMINKHNCEILGLLNIPYKQGAYEDKLVYVDIYRLKEVIDNIIDNAIKYGDHKCIAVDFYEEDFHTIIRIQNTGELLHEHDVVNIFQSFYRGKNIGKQKGNGLGLYICKQLMKQMNGDIFLTQEDHYVTFHIVLDYIAK